MKLQVLYSIFIILLNHRLIVLNHRLIGSLSYLVEKYSVISMREDATLVSAKDPLMHHSIVVFMYALASPMMGLAHCYGYDAYMSSFAEAQGPVIVMILVVLKMLNDVFITIFSNSTVTS